MKILLVGNGVMAKYVENSIKEKGYKLVAKVDYLGKAEYSSFDKIDKDFDIIIDFSHHSITNDLLDFAISKKKNILIATTGHNEQELLNIEKASEKIAILKSTNTSFGVNALNLIIEYATKILSDFDIELIEKHHNRKIDAPSGTANTLLNIIDNVLQEKRTRVYGRENIKREKKEIGIHSLRAGNIVGEHTVIFSKQDEIIEIKHEALSRKIFADGAVNVLEKLLNKESGYYEMRDLI